MLSGKKCSFCGEDVVVGQGITMIKNDGTITNYCSSKCRKNALKLKRDARKLKWTSKFVKSVKKWK